MSMSKSENTHTRVCVCHVVFPPCLLVASNIRGGRVAIMSSLRQKQDR